MSTRELKKTLVTALQMEQELYDFCVECLKEIFPEMYDRAIYKLDEDLENFHHYGCIQPLNSIKLLLAREIKETQDLKEKRREVLKQEEE